MLPAINQPKRKIDMNFGIIAAGEGSRLAGEGAGIPKPLIPIDGVPMIERLIRIFERCSATSINVVINSRMPEVREFLSSLKLRDGIEFNLKIKDTPSSMHTFFELSEMLRGKGRFITTTVDTIFPEEAFRRYVDAYRVQPGTTDGMMAVTDFVDDEKPLYVKTDGNLDILDFCDSREEGCEYISGGIYGLSDKAFGVLDECMRSGVSRMRNFQRMLVRAGLKLKAFPMGKIIDVDHLSDVATAEKFLRESAMTLK